jgi:RNAse (barnase) inhibitor barstar
VSAFHPLRTLGSRASVTIMKVVRLDASGWRSPEDFYSALLPRLGAPAWHGRNLDALEDSLYGGINEAEPPFKVEVEGAASLPPEMREFLSRVTDVFNDGRNATGDDIALSEGRLSTHCGHSM